MRARVILLVVAILLVAGFAAMNWDEFTRTAPLSFGTTVQYAPLGLIMLGLLAVLLLAFVISAAMHRTQTLVETRHHYREMEAQRDLAEKAEASRFTDLRQYMDTQLRDLHRRDEIAATEFHRAMVEAQRDLRTHLDQTHRMMSARFDEFERRMDGHIVHPREERLLPEERMRAVEEDRIEPPPQVRHPL
jgi:hypothetical protein